MLLPLFSNLLLALPIWKRALGNITALSLAGCIVFAPGAALAAEITASELISLTNKERAALGLPEFSTSGSLAQSAREKAEDLLEKSYFAHTNPKGKPFYEWIEASGYNYLYAGENLAIDFSEPGAVVSAWMESPAHQANIVNERYTDIGIAVVEGMWNNRETVVVVQHFGSLVSEQPAVMGSAFQSIGATLGLGRDAISEFALTEQRATARTPVSYPTLAYIARSIAARTATVPAFPRSLNTNLVIAGIVSMLLLAAFESEIRRELAVADKQRS